MALEGPIEPPGAPELGTEGTDCAAGLLAGREGGVDIWFCYRIWETGHIVNHPLIYFLNLLQSLRKSDQKTVQENIPLIMHYSSLFNHILQGCTQVFLPTSFSHFSIPTQNYIFASFFFLPPELINKTQNSNSTSALQLISFCLSTLPKAH